MTREEAIADIKFAEYKLEKVFPGLDEALEMAIKALEQEPSEDCISRTEALYALNRLTKHEQIGEVEWSLKESDIRGMLRKLPRVVPREAEEEDKQRGKLERFTSVELKKILDNFCEQMECPLPERTKNEIVANVAREHAMTVAADRLDQAMKESEE